jgi:uncharacterized small protein (TIGR04563 family)
MLGEMRAEAKRQERSLSKIVQMAVRTAMSQIKQFPSAPGKSHPASRELPARDL